MKRKFIIRLFYFCLIGFFSLNGYLMADTQEFLTTEEFEQFSAMSIDDHSSTDFSDSALNDTSNQRILPNKLNWRNYNGLNAVTKVKEQKCNDSWAFAAVAALESRLFIDTQQKFNLSEQVLVSTCSGAGNCTNGNIWKATRFLVNKGVPKEKCYKYKGVDSNCNEACIDWQTKALKANKRTKIQRNVEALKNALYDYGPLVAGMNVYEDFKNYAGGVYKSTSTTPEIGALAILIYGYNDKQNCFMAKNSWGKAWGNNGFFRIDYSHVTDRVKFGKQAWALGEPLNPGPEPEPEPPPQPDPSIKKDETISGLSGEKGMWSHFWMEVPRNARNLEVNINGGNGDADLYIRFNEKATNGEYECRPYQAGNAESCTIEAPTAGPCFISLFGYNAYSNVKLFATYEDQNQPQEFELKNGEPVIANKGKKHSWRYYFIAIPDGATDLTIEASGGTGDADIYTQLGEKPTQNSYDCRPYKNGNNESCTEQDPKSGIYYIGVRAYKKYNNLSITASYRDGSPIPNIIDVKNNEVIPINFDTKGQWQLYRVQIPIGTEKLQVQTYGGTGDLDMYTQMDAPPTADLYACRPYTIGNNEVCNFVTPDAKECYIGLYSYGKVNKAKLRVRLRSLNDGEDMHETVFIQDSLKMIE